MAKMQKRDDRYKWAIHKAVMTALFTKMEKIHAEEVNKLAVQNFEIMGYTHLSFAYNGQFYSVDGTEGPPVRQRLHPSLVSQAIHMEAEFGHPLAYERSIAANYLSSVLAFSQYPGDYLLLLPGALTPVVSQAIVCSDWSTTLTPEKMAAFKAKHQKGYELIRNRLALNLLL
jgi:hypothetical protein